MYKIGDKVLINKTATSLAGKYIGEYVTIKNIVNESDGTLMGCVAQAQDGMEIPLYKTEFDPKPIDVLTSREASSIFDIFNRIQNISIHDKRPTPGGYSTVVDSSWVSRHVGSGNWVRQNPRGYFSYSAYASQESFAYYFSSSTQPEAIRRLDGTDWSHYYVGANGYHCVSDKYFDPEYVFNVRLASAGRDSQLRSRPVLQGIRDSILSLGAWLNRHYRQIRWQGHFTSSPRAGLRQRDDE